MHNQPQQEQDILKRYSLRILTEKHIKEALNLFKEDFNKYESIRAAFYKKYPETIPLEYYQYWDNLAIVYRDEMFNKGLSIGCFDIQNNEELVGVTLAKDMVIGDQLDKVTAIIRAVQKLDDKMNASLTPQHLHLIRSKEVKILEQWLFVIKSGHNGKGLLHRMIAAGDYLGSRQKFEYSLCGASSFKTGKALKRLNYEKIGEVDAKDFQYEGQKYFELIDEELRMQTLWLKKIEEIQENSLPMKIDF